MTSIGVGTIAAGRGAARVKGATRDVYAAIRHARSTALVTGQPVTVSYSNETSDDEVAVKIEVAAVKIMSAVSRGVKPQPYYVMDYKELPQAKVETEAEGEKAESGETLEDVLFSPMDSSVVKGMRIKVLKGDEELVDETAAQTKSRISVFSNVDYLKNRYQETKSQEKVEGEAKGEKGGEGDAGSGSANDMNEPVSVVWQTNGSVEPHRIWIYPDGKKPEDGLMLNVDQFGAVKVLDGDGREDE